MQVMHFHTFSTNCFHNIHAPQVNGSSLYLNNHGVLSEPNGRDTVKGASDSSPFFVNPCPYIFHCTLTMELKKIQYFHVYYQESSDATEVQSKVEGVNAEQEEEAEEEASVEDRKKEEETSFFGTGFGANIKTFGEFSLQEFYGTYGYPEASL